MSAAGRWFVSPHAVRQYVRRVRPGCSYDQALTDLIHLSQTARPAKRLETGVWLYRGPRPERLRCYVGEARLGQLRPLITVLKGHDHD